MEDQPEMEMKSDGMKCPEIDLPKGFSPPEDSQEGEEITVLCKIKPTANGRAMITSVDGAPYEGYEKDKEEGEKVEDVNKEESQKDVTVPTTQEGNSEQESNPSMGLADKIKELRMKLSK